MKKLDLKELIEKVERTEKQLYGACQMVSDLRVLIIGLFDEMMWWREKVLNVASNNTDDSSSAVYKIGDCKRLWCSYCDTWMFKHDDKYTCPKCGLNFQLGDQDV